MFPAVGALMASTFLPPGAWLLVMEASSEAVQPWDLGPGEREQGAALRGILASAASCVHARPWTS